MQSMEWDGIDPVKSLMPLLMKLAEVPCTAWANLQPAERLLICEEFSKICPSALEVRGPG